jgi:hypothetical protein
LRTWKGRKCKKKRKRKETDKTEKNMGNGCNREREKADQ